MLKQLIQKLLDSRTTPAQAGNSAMPGATKTIFLSKDETVGSWGIINAGTAPDDGYLLVLRTIRIAKSERNLAIFFMCLRKRLHQKV